MLRIRRNIRLGRDEYRHDNPIARLKNMSLFALGQRKMFRNVPVAILHLFIYLAFIITQIELLEVIIDGTTGTCRAIYHFVVATWAQKIYVFTISLIEILSALALLATIIFLIRRNIIHITRFHKPELRGFPFKDGNYILFGEIWLISCIFLMNSADMASVNGAYGFAISKYTMTFIQNYSNASLHLLERIGWWGHLLGILGFMVYLPFSKHLHIFLAFPNSYYGDINHQFKGSMKNMPAITNEVRLMMDPNAILLSVDSTHTKFGAADITDLTWKNLLDAYSCTECGRCTAACPANQTGKLLSPRKIMMDTRDRIEEIAILKDKNMDLVDGRSLLRDYITEEELKACTTCNACVEECPVNINPLDIILQMRRHLVMEESNAPTEWNSMFSNIENNMAPWKFNPAERANWINS